MGRTGTATGASLHSSILILFSDYYFSFYLRYLPHALWPLLVDNNVSGKLSAKKKGTIEISILDAVSVICFEKPQGGSVIQRPFFHFG